MRKHPVVVITGASSGIGRATALAFAAKGAKVVVASRRGEVLEEVVGEIEASGGTAFAIPADVSDNDHVEALAAAAVGKYGRIDVWVNDAGVGVYSRFVEHPLEDFRRVLDVNVMGTVHGSRAALTQMYAQGRGVLINVASVEGQVAQPYFSSYTMSKAAVLSLGQSLRQELMLEGAKKIKVVSILPPVIDTPFFRHAGNYTGRALGAMPPVYPPELVARTIVKTAWSPRDEVVIGHIGRILSRQHKITPALVQGQMAGLVNTLQLSSTEGAAHTSGNLYEPAEASGASVTGGWNGARAASRRRVLAWTVVLVGGGLILRHALKER